MTGWEQPRLEVVAGRAPERLSELLAGAGVPVVDVDRARDLQRIEDVESLLGSAQSVLRRAREQPEGDVTPFHAVQIIESALYRLHRLDTWVPSWARWDGD